MSLENTKSPYILERATLLLNLSEITYVLTCPYWYPQLADTPDTLLFSISIVLLRQ